MPSSACHATTAVYTLSLHDALPISSFRLVPWPTGAAPTACPVSGWMPRTSLMSTKLPERRSTGPEAGPVHRSSRASLSGGGATQGIDRKSTRLNSSHVKISYAVFCLSRDYRCLHSFPTRRSSDLEFPVGAVADRGGAYSMPGVRVDAQDVLDVYEASREAVDRARSGAGPSLIESVSLRWRGHAGHRSEEHTSELQSRENLVCRLLLVTRLPLSTLFPYTTLFRSRVSGWCRGRPGRRLQHARCQGGCPGRP